MDLIKIIMVFVLVAEDIKAAPCNSPFNPVGSHYVMQTLDVVQPLEMKSGTRWSKAWDDNSTVNLNITCENGYYTPDRRGNKIATFVFRFACNLNSKPPQPCRRFSCFPFKDTIPTNSEPIYHPHLNKYKNGKGQILRPGDKEFTVDMYEIWVGDEQFYKCKDGFSFGGMNDLVSQNCTFPHLNKGPPDRVSGCTDRITCQLPGVRSVIFHYGNSPPLSNVVKFSEKLKIYCRTGYQIEGGKTSYTTTCKYKHNKYNSKAKASYRSKPGLVPDLNQCRPVSCARAFSNGVSRLVHTVYSFNETVVFRCHPGFLTEAGAELELATCTYGGKYGDWNKATICTRRVKYCVLSMKPEVNYVAVVNGTEFKAGSVIQVKVGDTVMYKCQTGYSFDGAYLDTTGLTCNKLGKIKQPSLCKKPRADNAIALGTKNKSTGDMASTVLKQATVGAVVGFLLLLCCIGTIINHHNKQYPRQVGVQTDITEGGDHNDTWKSSNIDSLFQVSDQSGTKSFETQLGSASEVDKLTLEKVETPSNLDNYQIGSLKLMEELDHVKNVPGTSKETERNKCVSKSNEMGVDCEAKLDKSYE